MGGAFVCIDCTLSWPCPKSDKEQVHLILSQSFCMLAGMAMIPMINDYFLFDTRQQLSYLMYNNDGGGIEYSCTKDWLRTPAVVHLRCSKDLASVYIHTGRMRMN